MAMPKVKTEMISFRAEDGFKAKVQAYAEKEQLTFTEAITELIENSLKN